MSLLSRLRNVFQADRSRREIDEEFESHIQEAIDDGRDPAEVRRAFGSPLRHRERSRDVRMLGWLDSLRADAVFGWRQIRKNKATSATVIISLGLAIGSSIAAFRLIDAMLFRPLPIANPDRLHSIQLEGFDVAGKFNVQDIFNYERFERMRDAGVTEATFLVVSMSSRGEASFGGRQEPDRVYRQYVSGTMFDAFGLNPAVGRLLRAGDDVTPGGHPVAVLSHDFWTRRFSRDPAVVGQTMRLDGQVYEVVGVVERGFTGVEPGVFIDVYLPAMMHGGVEPKWVGEWVWLRAFAVLEEGVDPRRVQARLAPVMRAFQQEGVERWGMTSPLEVERWLNQKLLVTAAPNGASNLRTQYREALIVIAVLVGLVLLIACANVANLLSAQATARSREMALRVSIGAGRARLAQLVLIQSALLALLASAVGALFAWQAAPLVVSMIQPSAPPRLALPADWRVMGFGLALALSVTCLFGLAPALRASLTEPSAALKGGSDPHSRRRLTYALVGVQTAFCFVVTIAAGLFAGSLAQLTNQPMGFEPEGVLLLTADAPSGPRRPVWEQAVESVRAAAGVEHASLSHWPLLGGSRWSDRIWVDEQRTEVLSYFLGVSPGWTDAMGIARIEGRDLRPEETDAALVNEAFVRECFGGGSALGRSFDLAPPDSEKRRRYEVVGVVENARYRDLREPLEPTAYVGIFELDENGEESGRSEAILTVRAKAPGDPMALSATLRESVEQARPEIEITNVRTQQGLIDLRTLREKLLAALGMFFAAVAVLLAGVGLYGVLAYSVIQRRREIGIRRAVGAPTGHIAWTLTAGAALTLLLGALVGGALSVVLARQLEALLYGVEPTDASILAPTAAVIAVAAALAAAPAVLRAIRIDPAEILRAE